MNYIIFSGPAVLFDLTNYNMLIMDNEQTVLVLKFLLVSELLCRVCRVLTLA